MQRVHDGIPLGIYCRQSLAQYLDPEEIFEITRQGFDFYHQAFAVRYPFGKYDQLFAPEYKAGAMENAGCVTFLEDYIFRSRVTDGEHENRAETILHEMAHMWFGDMVTMKWWDDLWLNESFATWASLVAMTEATRWPTAWTSFAQGAKAYAYRQDQLPSTHPIAADIPDIEAVEVNFDGITYEKGASVLKQLVAYVGQDNFLAGVRDYFGKHAWGNATLADLLSSLEQASGRDLAAWSKSWLETAGVNTLRARYEVGPDGTFTDFAVHQEAAASHPELRPHRIAIGLYDHAAGRLTRARRVELDIAGPVTPVPELIGAARPDVVLVNDDDLTYAKIRLDEHSLATVITSIGEFDESLPATLCWAAAWDMTRDAEMSTQEFLALVTAGAPSIGEITVLERVLGDDRHRRPPVRRPGLAAGRDGAVRPDAARLAPGRRAGLGPAARVHRGPGRRRDHAGKPRPARGPAGRLGRSRRPRGRHRPALAARAPAGQPRRHRAGRRSRRSWCGTRPTPASGTRRPAWPRSPPSSPRPRRGRRSRAARCRTPPSAPCCADSPTRIRTSCSRRTPGRSTRRCPPCGVTGPRTWRSSSPRTPTRSP